MKKFLLSIIVFSALFMSCKMPNNDPTYIEKIVYVEKPVYIEKLPEKPELKEEKLLNISRCVYKEEEYVFFIENNCLKYKLISDTSKGWDKFPIFIGNIIKTVTDSSNVYILTYDTSYKLLVVPLSSNENKLEITDLTQKYEIDLPIETFNGKTLLRFNIFSTNNLDNSKQYAYLRLGDYGKEKYFRLEGEGKLEEFSITEIVDENNSYPSVNSAISNNDTIKFYKSPIVVEGNGHVYYVNNNEVYKDDNYNKIISLNETITSLAITGDSLLIGTDKGLKRVRLDERDIPNSSIETILSSSYKVLSLLSVFSSKSEAHNIIYVLTSVVIDGKEDISLWSYYPSRGTWDKE